MRNPLFGHVRFWQAEGRAMACLALFGAVLMLLAAAPGLTVLAVLMTCLGIPLSPWLGSRGASVQHTVPAARYAEAFAWSFAVVRGCMAAGSAIGGVVIQSTARQLRSCPPGHSA